MRFTLTFQIAESMGFKGEFRQWEHLLQLIESGATSLPSGRLPVNAGGGLIGDGHPVGATGVRQVAEVFTQLTGKTGARQIDGTERFLTCNTGGSVRTSVEVVWEAF